MRITYARFALATLAGLLPVVAVVSACSGDTKKEPADTWVTGLCDIAASYKKVTDQEGEKLASIDPDKDAKGAKQTLLDAFSSVEGARSDFSKGLDKLGEPDLKSGGEVVKAFKAHDDASKKQLDDVKKQIEKLDPSSKTFSADLEKVLTGIPDPDFRAEMQKVADKQSDAGEVIDGIDKDPACAEVIFGGSGDSAAATTPTPAPKATSTAKATGTVKAGSTAKATGTVRARTTVKPNASVNERWVVGLCVATQSFIDDIEALSGGLDVNGTNDPAKLKQIMVNFLDDATNRSDQFKRDIDKLPTPDVKDGRKIQAAMSDASGRVADLFAQSADDARNLNASDAQKLADGLQTLGDNLDTASSDVSDAFDQIDRDYDTSALTTIANQVPECASFFN